jgi:transposase
MKGQGRYPLEVRERAVRLVFEQQAGYDSQWEAIRSVAEKIGCSTETLRKWVRVAERLANPTEQSLEVERERLRVLERENRELRQANEILRKAAAFFALAELDRPRR